MATEQELQSLFDTLDGDKDGLVSINELFLSPGLSAIISSETGISSPQELLSRYASNEDGSITFEELKQAYWVGILSAKLRKLASSLGD